MQGRFKVHRVDFTEMNRVTIHEGMNIVGDPDGATTPDGDAYSIASTTCMHDPAGRRRPSLAQFTREVLPRMENYRHSKRAASKRPSLSELHGGEELFIKDPNVTLDIDAKPGFPSHEGGIKLGWIQGVLIPCLLNIWGVMLFLRLSWVVAQSGIGHSLLIIAISAVVCVITTLSLSALCTNGEVKGGGIYYIISRSLGPEFGASVGVVFAFANAVSASMNTIGFCNSLNDLLAEHGLKIVDGGVNDVRIVGIIAILAMIFICCVGMEWESKAQNLLVAIILGAIVDFIVGTCIGPIADDQRAKGFTGLNADVFRTNWYPNYRENDQISYDFFGVFAIFFPSVTGIQAGANISGDLKDPASSIPKGTLLALLISMCSYAAFVVLAGGAAIRDASGNVADLINGTMSTCTSDCPYGLHNNYSMMQIMSSWGPLIYAGCFAATISTALTNLLSVPRLIQALGIDSIYPKLIFFSKGYGKSGEPYRGYVLTFIVAALFLLIADLNLVAPLISTFYLASYALINFCTFHAALIKPLGWRPTFRFYNTWLSLFGFFICVGIMFLISWVTSLITFIVICTLYLVVVYRKPDVNWGSSPQAQTYKTALTAVHRLTHTKEHVKNYMPQILVLAGHVYSRPPLIDFANLITKNNSLLVLGEISDKHITYSTKMERTKQAYQYLRSRKIKGFTQIVDGSDFEMGAKALIQASGVGKLAPNTLMMGYKNDWRTCNMENLLAYFNVIHNAFHNRLAVAILRLQDGLDYSRIMDEDDAAGCYSSGDLTLVGSPQVTQNGNLHSPGLMHIDSNLNISHMAPLETEHSNSLPILAFLNNIKLANHANSKSKKRTAADKILFTSPSGQHLNRSILDNITIFKRKQQEGYIDVWWLYDDGGFTVLIPYIIATRQDWACCKLRIFALMTNKNQLAADEQHLANLLTKFRLEFSSIKLVDATETPKQSTIDLFESLIEDFREKQNGDSEGMITDTELNTLREKTYKHLRLRELLIENSTEAKLIFMSLPMPRKRVVSAPLYMAWLEILTRDLPPFLLVRGNQQPVLTVYS